MKVQEQLLLSMPNPFNRIRKKISEMGFQEKEITNQLHLIISVFNRVIKGVIQAAIFISDEPEEKPVEKQEISGGIPVIIVGEENLE